MFFILTNWCDGIFILYFVVLYLHASLINLFLPLHHLENINLSDTCHNTVFQLVVKPVDVTHSVAIYGWAAFKWTTSTITVASRMAAIQSLPTSQQERWMFQVTVLWIYSLKMTLWGWKQIGVHEVLIRWWFNNIWVHMLVFLRYFWWWLVIALYFVFLSFDFQVYVRTVWKCRVQRRLVQIYKAPPYTTVCHYLYSG
jgi:hypothetical protein